MDESLENMKVQVGLDVIMLGSIGVYTHCLADPDQRSIATCSVIASAGPRVSASTFVYFMNFDG